MFNRHTTESVLNAPLPPLSEEQRENIGDIKNLSEKFGYIDLSHNGEKGITHFNGEKRNCIELYRTDNFCAYKILG